MLDFKNEKHRNYVAIAIVFFIAIIYQSTKKDNPKTIELTCKRLQTEQINGVIIRTSTSRNKDFFSAEIYNSEKRIKYSIDQWMIDSPRFHLEVGDSIIKIKDSKDYIIFREANDSLVMIKLSGDCRNIRLKK